MLNRNTVIASGLIIFLLSLTGFSNSAYGQDPHWYAGASVGQGSASGIDDVSITAFYWGRRVTDWLAIENALVDMGEFNHGKGMDDIAFDISVLGLKRIGESVEVYLKGGLHIWNLDDEIGEESSSYLVGFGVNNSFGQKMGARLEWVSFISTADDVEDIDTLSLGLYVNF